MLFPQNGARKKRGGSERVYYDGYWIRCYHPPAESMEARKQLIDTLNRRTFHHTERGINTPGGKLHEARAAYQSESDPQRKRVNAAMLAGALFNRATDIFHSLVELSARGVAVHADNALMRECGEYLREALELGGQVKHYSGQAGIDELWGEPFKAFSLPLADFYQSRYIKIAKSMKNIDQIAAALTGFFAGNPDYRGLPARIKRYAAAAKKECEIMKTDPDIFRVWPEFVAAGEQLENFRPENEPADAAGKLRRLEELRLIREGRDLINYVADARVPMPESSGRFFEFMERATVARRG